MKYVHGVFSATSMGAVVAALVESWWSLHTTGISTGAVAFADADSVGASVLELVTMVPLDEVDDTVAQWLDDPTCSYESINGCYIVVILLVLTSVVYDCTYGT